MEDTTRRSLFGIGAGLGAVALAGGASASTYGPYRGELMRNVVGVSMQTWTPPRHWEVTPELERKLSDDIELNATRYRAQAHADLIVHTLRGDGREAMLFTPMHGDGHALTEYMLRQGWIKTNAEASTDGAGALLPYGYSFTDRARVEAAILAASELERLSPEFKAQLGEMAMQIDRDDATHYVRPADLITWHDSIQHREALSAEREGVLKRLHTGGAPDVSYTHHRDKAWVTVRYADGHTEDVDMATHRSFNSHWELTEYGYWSAHARHWTQGHSAGPADIHFMRL